MSSRSATPRSTTLADETASDTLGATLDAPDLYDEFLEEMEALGLLENLEDRLPPAFSAVYEIGRILSDPSSELGRALSSALSLSKSGTDAPQAIATPETDALLVELPAGEEYEAEFIRSWSDVRYVYSWQHLLPEEVFLRRLADRRLWFPMAKAPRIHAIDAGEDDFQPTPSKQKAYVLLDTSRSMALHFRFALAKAAVTRFLKVNRRELGEIFLRTFDVDVGKLHSASDRSSYESLLRAIGRQSTLGNGTCLERAILQACADVRERRGLAGAEILVITDGAARVDEGKVREALGDHIRLHILKIGRAQVFATDQFLRDAVEFPRDTGTRTSQRLIQLRDRQRRIERGLRNEKDASTRSGLESELRQVRKKQERLADDLRRDFGHEIEHIAHLFIEIDDLDPEEAFGLDDAALESLKRLAKRLLRELDAAPAPPESMKKAALLMGHLQLLAAAQGDPVAREFIEALREALEKQMERALESHEEHLLQGGLLSHADQRDLRVLLHGGSKRGSSLWLMLLRYFYETVAKVVRRRRRH